MRAIEGGETRPGRHLLARVAVLGALTVIVLGGSVMLPSRTAAPSAAAPSAEPGAAAQAVESRRTNTVTEALAPGTTVEVVTATDLFAMPPGVLRSVKARVQNRIGTLQPGAEVAVVDASESFYKVALECQDGKVRVQAWIERGATRPAASR